METATRYTQHEEPAKGNSTCWSLVVGAKEELSRTSQRRWETHFSQCLCHYTKGTGADTPGCSCFLPRIPACSYLLRTVTDSYFGGKAVAILRLQTKICMKNMEVFWLFTHVFQASYVLFPQLKFTMYIRDSQKWGRESQEWYFIKGELVFQLHIYLYLFISTARRRCCLDPPWPGRP